MCDRQATGILVIGLEPVPVTRDQHVQITHGDIIQAALPDGVTVGKVAVDRLMSCRPQPVQHRPASSVRSARVDDT
jgi:hypothetical protein